MGKSNIYSFYCLFVFCCFNQSYSQTNISEVGFDIGTITNLSENYTFIPELFVGGDLINNNFAMIGFSKIEDIKKQFDISLVKQKKSESEDFIQVHLKVKPNSVYKDNYVSIDFWIDKKLGLPVKVVTVSTEPATEPVEDKDVSEIKFIKPEFNKKIDKKVFDLKIPAGFDEPDIQPLSKKSG